MEIDKRNIGYVQPVNQDGEYHVVGGDKCSSAYVACFEWEGKESHGYFVRGLREAPTLNQSFVDVRGICSDLGLSSGDGLNACIEKFGSRSGPDFNEDGGFEGVSNHTNNLANGSLNGTYELNFDSYACGGEQCVNIAGKEVTIDHLHGVIVDNSREVVVGKEPQVMYDPSCASALIAPFALAAALAPRIRSFYHKIRSKFSSK